MLGLAGLAFLLWGLWTGLGGAPFVFCLIGIVLLLVADDQRRSRY